jgi:hypothetical protein
VRTGIEQIKPSGHLRPLGGGASRLGLAGRAGNTAGLVAFSTGTSESEEGAGRMGSPAAFCRGTAAGPERSGLSTLRPTLCCDVRPDKEGCREFDSLACVAEGYPSGDSPVVGNFAGGSWASTRAFTSGKSSFGCGLPSCDAACAEVATLARLGCAAFTF